MGDPQSSSKESDVGVNAGDGVKRTRSPFLKGIRHPSLLIYRAFKKLFCLMEKRGKEGNV